MLKLSLISLYRQRLPRYRQIFKIAIFGHEAWPFTKLHIYALSTPGRRNWADIRSTGSGFRDTERFLKLPYLGMKPGEWPKCQKLNIYPISTPWGRNWAYFSSTRSGFQDMGRFSILSYLGMKLSHHQNFQKLHIYPLPSLGVRNWVHFHSTSTDSGFRDMGRFSKLPYLGMKLGKWPKWQKLHIYFLSTPSGQNWAYFRSTGSGLRDTGRFQNCHIWTWNLAIGQSSTYTLFLAYGGEIELIFALRAAVSEIRGRISKLPYLGMKLCHWPKCQRLHI